MNKFAMGLAAVTALIGTSALAAPPAPAPSPMPMSWAGVYIGGNVGGAFHWATGTSNYLDTTSNPPGQHSNPQNNTPTPTSFIGGGQVGINVQLAPSFVAGVEADWDWTKPRYTFCRQTVSGTPPCSDTGAGFETISSKTEWLATARGRMGLTWRDVWGNWLLFGTGGAAFGRVDTTLSLSCLAAGCGSSTKPLAALATTGTDKSGWVAGLGAELMLASNWSLRLEWLHIDLGTINSALPTAGARNGVPSVQTATWSRSETFEVVRIGLNYLFRM